MDISIEELYMLLGVKDAQIYKLQQTLRQIQAAKNATTTKGADVTPPVEKEN